MNGVAEWESRWRRFERDASLDVSFEEGARAIDALVERLHDNYPFFHPDYAGQMLKPPHPIALAAYAAAARINPNNHALDGGPATAALEREVVAEMARMFGLGDGYLGHLTSSGTIANLEALWVATRLKPGKAIGFSTEAHYTHGRMCALLGVPALVLPVDAQGKLDVGALGRVPDDAGLGTVVVTAGCTATGAVDPIDAVVELAAQRGWRVHADAAYGGFFALLAGLPEARIAPEPWQALARCDSVVVDPHKHGLQPYGCGCVLFADGAVAALYKHDSPYTYFTAKTGATPTQIVHLGEATLECSRAGAAAAALWATLRCLPLSASGLGRALLRSRLAALEVYRLAHQSERLLPVIAPELDIVTIALARRGESPVASELSARAQRLFDGCERDQEEPLYLALWRLPREFGELALPGIEWDRPECTVIRSVLMKPEHAARAGALTRRLESWQ